MGVVVGHVFRQERVHHWLLGEVQVSSGVCGGGDVCSQCVLTHFTETMMVNKVHTHQKINLSYV